LVTSSVGKIGRITPGRQEWYSQRAITENRAGYEVVSWVIFSMIKLEGNRSCWMEWVIRIRLSRQTLLGFRLISELLSVSDCDIRCEGYGRDRHTSVFLVFPFE
jgi:hypothetical protein